MQHRSHPANQLFNTKAAAVGMMAVEVEMGLEKLVLSLEETAMVMADAETVATEVRVLEVAVDA